MGQKYGNRGRSVGGALLIGVGGLFLLAQLGLLPFSLFGAIWPFFIIVPGLAFLYFARSGGKDTAPLAIPGSIVTGTGALLLLQSVTGHWESWAYAWALYPVFLGLGLMYMGREMPEAKTYNVGSGFVRWGATVFAAFAALFELFIFDHNPLLNYLLPVTLLVAGGWMLLRGRQGGGRHVARGPRKRRIALDDDDIFTGAPVMGRRSRGFSASDDLRRRIDLALAEDDDDMVVEPASTGPEDL